MNNILKYFLFSYSLCVLVKLAGRKNQIVNTDILNYLQILHKKSAI
jgi:hypothetical protein